MEERAPPVVQRYALSFLEFDVFVFFSLQPVDDRYRFKDKRHGLFAVRFETNILYQL